MSIRKAFLVGINAYPDAPLRGCINDVNQVKDLLTGHYGFTEADIKLLEDQDATSSGIKNGLEWLAQGGADPDAVRVFHYSGHGSQVADQNGDEADGADECLVPVDYETSGFLTDDVLKTFYDRFPKTGNLTLIMDSCHSGTVTKDISEDVIYRFLPITLDEQERIDAAKAQFVEDQHKFLMKSLKEMPFETMSEAELEAKVRSLSAIFEKKRFGDVRAREGNILLAGCRDNQTSADAYIKGNYHGAFTYYIMETIAEANYQLTYHDLAKKTGLKLYNNRYNQIPQLEYRSRRDQKLLFTPFNT